MEYGSLMHLLDCSYDRPVAALCQAASMMNANHDLDIKATSEQKM